jgi:hypothetical protein
LRFLDTEEHGRTLRKQKQEPRNTRKRTGFIRVCPCSSVSCSSEINARRPCVSWPRGLARLLWGSCARIDGLKPLATNCFRDTRARFIDKFMNQLEERAVRRVDGDRLDKVINSVNTTMEDRIDEIGATLAAGKFRFSFHATQRMRQRAVTKADIQACGRTARSCVYQAESGTYRIQGEDLDGEPITVICGLDDIVFIVTIF